MKDFVVQKFLGQGSFGAVYKVKRKSDGKIYAMKQVNTRKMSQKEREVAVNEIRILASTKNQYIIKFYEAFVHDQMLYIITEYAANGDVFQRLKRMKQKRQSMPEDVVWVFFIQLCLGIQALHRNNILHRDLKSANVFLSNHNCIKIGDLGVAKLLAASRAMAKTQIGTPYYVSPELWKNKPYNAKSDVWALGCLLYEMVMGTPPFESANMRGLAKKVMRGAYPAVSSRYSAELQGVIKKLLAVNPDNRPSIDQILQMDNVVSKMSLLPEEKVEAPGTAQSEKENMIRTIHVPRKLRDLTAVKNFPGPRYEAEQAPGAGGGLDAVTEQPTGQAATAAQRSPAAVKLPQIATGSVAQAAALRPHPPAEAKLPAINIYRHVQPAGAPQIHPTPRALTKKRAYHRQVQQCRLQPQHGVHGRPRSAPASCLTGVKGSR